MIRIFVIVLLGANLALLVFRGVQPQPAPPQHPVVTEAQIPRIALASEKLTEPEPDPPEQLAVTDQRCFNIGPLKSQATFQQYRSALQPVSDRILSQKTEETIERGFWVYLAPFDSKERAEQAVVRLQGLGVEDYYLIPHGDSANAVSLGVFASEQRALARKRQLDSLGLEMDVLVGRQTDSELRYWMKIMLPPNTTPGNDDLPGLPGTAQYQATPCIAG